MQGPLAQIRVAKSASRRMTDAVETERHGAPGGGWLAVWLGVPRLDCSVKEGKGYDRRAALFLGAPRKV